MKGGDSDALRWRWWEPAMMMTNGIYTNENIAYD